jgi:hypothetical protein
MNFVKLTSRTRQCPEYVNLNQVTSIRRDGGSTLLFLATSAQDRSDMLEQLFVEVVETPDEILKLKRLK